MRPARAVLEYALNAARKEFRSVSLTQAERIGCTVMYIPGGSAFGVSGQITQNWFDEPVVCWNGHIESCYCSTGDHTPANLDTCQVSHCLPCVGYQAGIFCRYPYCSPRKNLSMVCIYIHFI